MSKTNTGPRVTEDLDALPEQTLHDTAVDGHTRRAVLGRAAAGVAAGGVAATLLGSASAAASAGSSDQALSFIVTQEGFGVTFLTNAIRRAPGTPSAKFVDVLRAANMAEFDHRRALLAVGARPLTSRFWIPDMAFDHGQAGLFMAIEQVETIEVSLYQVGVTEAVRARQPFIARLCAAALGTEAEHRVLARFAQTALGKPVGVPNNVGFEPYRQRSATAARRALETLGIGYGRPGAHPGRFYEYPGNPQANGTGHPLISTVPA